MLWFLKRKKGKFKVVIKTDNKVTSVDFKRKIQGGEFCDCYYFPKHAVALLRFIFENNTQIDKNPPKESIFYTPTYKLGELIAPEVRARLESTSESGRIWTCKN